MWEAAAQVFCDIDDTFCARLKDHSFPVCGAGAGAGAGVGACIVLG